MSAPPPFPTLKSLPSAALQTILPNQLYILDLLPPSQTEKLLAWCKSQSMQGPTPAKKGEAERTAKRAAQESPDIASALLDLLLPHIRSLEPCPKQPLLSPNIRVYHYPPGTYFRGHYDQPQLDLASRRLSCWTVLIYLGECKGGGTSFYPHGTGGKSAGGKKKAKTKEDKGGQEKITVEAKAGRVLFHWHGVAAGGCMLHEGDEVLSGDNRVVAINDIHSTAYKMIHAVLIFNNHGKPRLSKFFTLIPPLVQQSLISQIFSLISDRPQGVCNFLDAPELVFPTPGMSREREEEAMKERNRNGKRKLVGGDDDTRVIYRHYATLYFVFVVDGAESELGILDLIQVFVESLDRAFENVCELDLIFHFDEVHYVLGEIIQGGLVLETNINEITACVQASSRNRKASAASANPLIPSALANPASSAGRVFARGGSADGPRKWLAAMGV